MEKELDFNQETLPPRSGSRRTPSGLRSELSLVILWHPDRAMMGRFARYPEGSGESLKVSRFSPGFYSFEESGSAYLSDVHISRSPITVDRLSSSEFRITPAESQMTVHVNGVRANSPVNVQLNDQSCMIVLTLSNHIVLGLCKLPLVQMAGQHNSLVGISQEINKCRNLINRFASTDLPVMLMGETGTGKELAASDIHANSDRSAGPLVTVNMAAIPQELAVTELFGSRKGAFTGSTQDRSGFFQKAENGTLFCDEIGDTPLLVQPILLRALESQTIQVLGHDKATPSNVRFIAATDRPVDVNTDDYKFSKPLYHRLSAAQIKMPPLRQRRVDIPILILHFLDQNEISERISHGDIDASQVTELLMYSWPGNVRELKNAINAIMLGEKPNLIENGRSLTSGRQSSKDQYRAPSSVANDELIKALNAADWLIKPAAESLSISRTSCYELIRKCPDIRPVEDIPLEELRQVVARHPGDLAAWSAVLKVPQEALRKHMRSSGLMQ